MKHSIRLFIVFAIAVLTDIAAFAQDNAIHLDAGSFRPLSTDALTNLAVDPIGNDRSNRPCARIKIRMDRMTPDEIRQTQIKLIGGNIMLTKRINADSGNGIIVEMTARKDVRFYLVHPQIGSSNTVIVSLEGGKEYQMNAWGNRSHSITIACDRVGADVYIDDAYAGKIGSGRMVTVPNIKSGDHIVRIHEGNDRTEESIHVSSDQVYFAIALKDSASMQKYVVFSVEPADAIVELDGTVLSVKDGKAYRSLRYGVHTYTVSAPRHHTFTGRIEIGEDTPEQYIISKVLAKAYGYLEIGKSASGAGVYVDGDFAGTAPLTKDLSSGSHRIKLIKPMHEPHEQTVTIKDGQTLRMDPTLTANYAVVTINAEKGAEIWIDMEKKGTGSWTGGLGYGLHMVEARKDGHRSRRISHEVTREESTHSLTLPALETITGSLVIESEPALADIYIDGKNIGKTPRRTDIPVGSHRIRISSKGYDDFSRNVTILEGKESNVYAVMKKEVKKARPARKLTIDTENMFQMGLGFEASFTTHRQYAFPIDFRIGRNDQIFNFFIGEAIGWDSANEPSQSSYADWDDYGSVTYFTTYTQARFNFFRSSPIRLFTYIGGNLHVNVGGKVEYSIVNNDYSEVRSTIDISRAVNPINYSGRFGIGFGGRVAELSVYCDYLFGNHFDMDYLSQERDYDEEWENLYNGKNGLDIITTNLSERNAGIWEAFSSRLSFGFSVKLYFFTGWDGDDWGF